MGAPRIILDTNVLISAFGFGGKPRQIIESVLAGLFELVISEKQMAEIGRVLDCPRLKFTEEEKQHILDVLGNVARIVETHQNINIIKEDPSDNLFLEAALEHNVTCIVSGDIHLLKIGEFRGVRILTPAQFLDHINNERQ